MPRPRLIAAAALCGAAVLPTAGHAGYDAFLGEIMFTSATFCPRGFTDADGQLLTIRQNEALYSLLGDRYGGDGRTTFGLPDLRKQIEDPATADEPRRRIRACVATEGAYPQRD